MEGYTTYRGYPVGQEIIPKNGWQREMYERGQRFFEPIPPALAATVSAPAEETAQTASESQPISVAEAMAAVEAAFVS